MNWITLATLFGVFYTAHTVMPTLKNLQVKCSTTGMDVEVFFDKPFSGVIFSKGHFYDPKCQYTHNLQPKNNFAFHIPATSCGSNGDLSSPTTDKEMYFENTIVIQNDPVIQEVWDQARLLRCKWTHTMKKLVRADPLKVADPEKVTVYLDSRAINTLMQIQKGTAPFSSPASGYIYKGEQSSIVIYAQDDTGILDANVVSCNAKSASGEIVPLVDSYGCVVDPTRATPFVKVREPNGISADLMFYSYIDGFTMGEDTEFQITCQLEICEGECLEPCSLKNHRTRRSSDLLSPENHRIQLARRYVVVTRDVEDEAKCGLTRLIAISITTLLAIVALQGIAVCLLIFKLYAHRRQKS